MKKIVCGCFGTIYYAEISKNGFMSGNNRKDVTDDALVAVLNHIMAMDEYKDRDGFSGYEYRVGESNVNLVVYDNTKYKLVRRDDTGENNSFFITIF